MRVGRLTETGCQPDELAGTDEIAQLIGIRRKSLYVYRSRGVMPSPAFTVSGVPLWWVSDVLEWDEARKTR